MHRLSGVVLPHDNPTHFCSAPHGHPGPTMQRWEVVAFSPPEFKKRCKITLSNELTQTKNDDIERQMEKPSPSTKRGLQTRPTWPPAPAEGTTPHKAPHQTPRGPYHEQLIIGPHYIITQIKICGFSPRLTIRL